MFLQTAMLQRICEKACCTLERVYPREENQRVAVGTSSIDGVLACIIDIHVCHYDLEFVCQRSS